MNWSTFGLAIDVLKELVGSLKPLPDVIVGIGRGGWMVAVPLSHALEVTECYGIRIVRNTSEQAYSERTDPVVLQSPSRAALNDHVVLLVDDIAGDGGTLETAKKVIRDLGARMVHTAVLVLNIAGGCPVDAYAVSVDDWIVFPWENNTKEPNDVRGFEVKNFKIFVKDQKE